ncbi:pilus assembly PilX family protein [Cellulomonas soli]
MPGSGVLRRVRGDGDEGMALVLVVGSMLVLAMLAFTALAFTMASQRFARYDQDYTSAMSAAQSGVDDYISRLNRSEAYTTIIDCANPAMKGPTTATNTCGWNASTTPGWSPVDGTRTGEMDAFFHYTVDASRVTTEGTVTLTVTGRANGEYRTIEAAVGKGGSTDYVYYTDFESADPSNVQAYPSGTSAACGGSGYDAAKYWWEGRSGAGCSEITFASGDTLQGSVFSNDSVLAAGPTFTDGFLTANPECHNVTTSTSSSNWKWCLRNTSGTYSTANFNGVLPQYHDPLYLDDTSAAFAGFPGCHYVGSTRIVFNSDGTMTVWNKTVNNGGTAPTASGANGGTAPSCGSLAQLDSASGATVSVPTDLVIYVGAAPSTVDRRKCYSGEIGGATGATLPLGTYKSTTPATPVQSTAPYTYDTNMNEATKYCAEGNVYVEGVLKGRVTVAAAQSVVVTGDIVLAGGLTGTDMLGLVATNSVEAFHPWVATYSPGKVNELVQLELRLQVGRVDVEHLQQFGLAASVQRSDGRDLGVGTADHGLDPDPAALVLRAEVQGGRVPGAAAGQRVDRPALARHRRHGVRRGLVDGLPEELRVRHAPEVRGPAVLPSMGERPVVAAVLR